MKAVVLAAGEGRRLRLFTETMPKVMLPVANKPILEHVIDSLKKSGIDEIIIIVGYKKEVILEHFRNYEGATLHFIHQDKQLGTAHALLQAKSEITDDFITLSGDNIIEPESITKILQTNHKHVMLVTEYAKTSKYGVVDFENNKLKQIFKEPLTAAERFISTGIYRFPPTIFTSIQDFCNQGNYSLFSVVQNLVDEKKTVFTMPIKLWMDIVYPWDLLAVNETLLQHTLSSVGGTIEKNVVIKGKVDIGPNTTIYAGSYLVGPIKIGEGCEIGPHVCIFPSTAIGDNVVISPFSEIENTVIMNDCHIGSNSRITHSIFGRGSIISSGFSSIAGETTIESEDQLARLKHIGVMIGEDCTINNQVVTDPGIMIGRGSNITSLRHITKKIPSKSTVM